MVPNIGPATTAASYRAGPKAIAGCATKWNKFDGFVGATPASRNAGAPIDEPRTTGTPFGGDNPRSFVVSFKNRRPNGTEKRPHHDNRYSSPGLSGFTVAAKNARAL